MSDGLTEALALETYAMEALCDLHHEIALFEAWRDVERSCLHPSLAFRDHPFTARVGDWGSPRRADGPSPALALCLALVRAVEAEKTQR